MPAPTIAVVGASGDRRKFGNKAVRAYAQRGYTVFPVHPSEAAVEGWPACRTVSEIPVERLDRVSIYLPPDVLLTVFDDIARKPVGQVWLNPGTERADVLARAQDLGLPVVVGCSILDIGVDPHTLS
jgi:uncharacterized protein